MKQKFFLSLIVIFLFFLNIILIVSLIHFTQEKRKENQFIFQIITENIREILAKSFANEKAGTIEEIIQQVKRKTFLQIRGLGIDLNLNDFSKTNDIFLPLGEMRKINSYYGNRKYINKNIGGVLKNFHTGLDFQAKKGDKIFSIANGRIIYAGYKGKYGKCVIIRHKNYDSLYAHLSKILITNKQYVFAGQKIGLVGQTGNTTGPHLHFEIRTNNIPVNINFFVLNLRRYL